MAGILAVSPSARAIGIAILEDTLLHDWNTHTTETAVLEAISNAIQEKNIEHIAILKPHPNRHSNLIETICSLANIHWISVSFYTPRDLKKNISHGKHKNNLTLFRYITELFPELKKPFHNYAQLYKPYWCKMLEAVSCAYICTLLNKP